MNYSPMIMADKPCISTIKWLRHVFLPKIVEKLNTSRYRRMLALYNGDRIPENERNLTDTRNRVSLIIEYHLAAISNEIFSEDGLNNIFCSSVVANRFPDLEYHNNQGKKGIRIEVKCIESIAEEKSANFDTLIKDIKLNSDYVIVFLWEWFKEQNDINWDRAPKILEAFVFHARSLAQLRDQSWLNSPSPNIKGFKGFDIRNAVVCGSTGEYSIEEGNYGKLLRIWKSRDIYFSFGDESLIKDTTDEYDRFKNETIKRGFDFISSKIAATKNEKVIKISDSKHYGYIIGDIMTILTSQELEGVRCRYSDQDITSLMDEYRVKIVIKMNEKYRSTVLFNNEGILQKLCTNEKPKKVYKILNPS